MLISRSVKQRLEMLTVFDPSKVMYSLHIVLLQLYWNFKIFLKWKVKIDPVGLKLLKLTHIKYNNTTVKPLIYYY